MFNRGGKLDRITLEVFYNCKEQDYLDADSLFEAYFIIQMDYLLEDIQDEYDNLHHDHLTKEMINDKDK